MKRTRVNFRVRVRVRVRARAKLRLYKLNGSSRLRVKVNSQKRPWFFLGLELRLTHITLGEGLGLLSDLAKSSLFLHLFSHPLFVKVRVSD